MWGLNDAIFAQCLWICELPEYTTLFIKVIPILVCKLLLKDVLCERVKSQIGSKMFVPVHVE
jgi:hypothetical protein